MMRGLALQGVFQALAEACKALPALRVRYMGTESLFHSKVILLAFKCLGVLYLRFSTHQKGFLGITGHGRREDSVPSRDFIFFRSKAACLPSIGYIKIPW